MAVTKLTRQALAKLGPGIYYDSVLTGFGLRIGSSGLGTWFAEYRPGGGGRQVRKKRVRIGHADRLSPEQAREAATKLLAGVALGADPAVEQAERRNAQTFEAVLDAYISDHVRAKRKPQTADYYEYLAKLHIKPRVGKKRSAEITRDDLRSMHLAIGREGGTYVANRALAVVSATFGWLDADGKNPAKGIEKFKEEPRERYLSEEEIIRVGDALREAETIGLPHQAKVGEISKHARKPGNRRTVFSTHITNAIRMLMLTGMRLREVLNLEWSHVDAERGLLFLPDSKTGRKTVVLAEPARELVRTTPRVGKYVFAGDSVGTEDEKPRSDLKRPWAAIQRRTGLSDVHLHDLRHTFGSIGAGSGLGLPVIGKLLGHSNPATTQRYAHVAVDASRLAADAIAGQIDAALKGASNG